MPTVKEDLAREHSVTSQTWRNTIVRTFHVTELVTAPQFQLMEALDQPEIPDYLDPYPFSVTPEYPEYETVRVRNRRAEPEGANAALVVVTYDNDAGTGGSDPSYPPVGSNDGPETRQTSFTTREITTRFDSGGSLMTIAPPPSVANQGNVVSTAVGTIVVGTVVYERTERTDPAARMRQYTGKVNSTSLGGGTYAAGTLLFDGIETSGNSNDGFRCRYEFRYDANGWQHVDVWRDPETGRIPLDAVNQFWDVAESIDFGPLGFDWDDP